MDRERFDALAKLLATTGSRRATLGALLGVGLFGQHPDALAKPGKRNDRKKDRKRRKKRGRRDNDGGGNGGPNQPTQCCGTKQCAPPEGGSTSAGCDFGGQSFAGQDLSGSIFRGIDGREANFNQTDNRGSVFAEACLHGATFRRARLGGSTWEDACLFGADFSGADIDDDDVLFADALFCRTIMPDGSVNNRDCNSPTACCLAELGDPCRSAPDCGEETCRTKACENESCIYTVVADGPSPNDLCDGHCCEGDCCPAGSTQCDPQGRCCAPNCDDRFCGPDGCGGDGTCGTCPNGTVCFDEDGLCVCNPGTCPDGCCSNFNSVCQPGTTPQACGSDGAPCVSCGGEEICRNGQCCAPDCAGRQCGPDGCGGQCGSCADGQRCQNGQCVCDAQSCPDGCCNANGACRPGTANQACGRGGAACESCPQGQECLGQQCGTCPTLTCQELGFACGSQLDRCGGTLQCGHCPLGATPSCQEGICRDCADVCPGGCSNCVQLLDGSTRCGASVDIDCDSPCSSASGCALDSTNPICAVSGAPRGSGDILRFPDLCRIPQSPGVCVAITPCCTPDCTGKTCGPDGCNGSCGACGDCEVCENGTCRPLQPNGLACTQDSDCCSENCFGGVCANSVTECLNGPCNPIAKGCVAGFCCSCDSPNDCCAGLCCSPEDQFCCNQEICCFNAQVCNGGQCIG